MADAIDPYKYGIKVTPQGLKKLWCTMLPYAKGCENTPANVKRLTTRAKQYYDAANGVLWGYQGSYIDTLTDGRITVINVFAVLNDRTITDCV
jgi:hypothetical protein